MENSEATGANWFHFDVECVKDSYKPDRANFKEVNNKVDLLYKMGTVSVKACLIETVFKRCYFKTGLNIERTGFIYS